ncbi:hypothetical protein [Pyruvatibacter mobilis]|uniref:hypothetical protein n=1 Tax=Pyruvatibacter mobilis TaxID=1712261 RepID=UPI003C7B31B2
MSIATTLRALLAALFFTGLWVPAALADRSKASPEPHPPIADPCKTGHSIKVDRNTPASNPLEANAVPDIRNVCWTSLTGQTTTYAGKTISTVCHPGVPTPFKEDPVEPSDYPIRAPIPCHADENQAGAYNYYDRLNWSIAAAERLNNWEHHLTPRLPRGPEKPKGINPCWSDPKASRMEVVLPSKATCPH